MASARLIPVCGSAALVDGGDGVRFDVRVGDRAHTGFVVRHRGRVVGYLNRCAHVALELDWLATRFFDAERELLICATHGATYEPQSGHCVGGPCGGRGGLRALTVVERDGRVLWQPDDVVRAPPASG
jgi:nitrite reductase/ring-hydroxylating ferredoxin subunit